jgi:hypothetical protein
MPIRTCNYMCIYRYQPEWPYITRGDLISIPLVIYQPEWSYISLE